VRGVTTTPTAARRGGATKQCDANRWNAYRFNVIGALALNGFGRLCKQRLYPCKLKTERASVQLGGNPVSHTHGGQSIVRWSFILDVDLLGRVDKLALEALHFVLQPFDELALFDNNVRQVVHRTFDPHVAELKICQPWIFDHTPSLLDSRYIRPMFNRARGAIFNVLSSPTGDGLPPVRFVKEMALRVNRTFGMPLDTKDALGRRADAQGRLNKLSDDLLAEADAAFRAKNPAPLCPVTLYRDREQGVLEVRKIEELFRETDMPYRVLDVQNDAAMQSFVRLGLGKAQLPLDTMPVLFVADRAVGGYREWVEAEASGVLKEWLAGNTRAQA
jgi:hypothetical protein